MIDCHLTSRHSFFLYPLRQVIINLRSSKPSSYSLSLPTAAKQQPREPLKTCPAYASFRITTLFTKCTLPCFIFVKASSPTDLCTNYNMLPQWYNYNNNRLIDSNIAVNRPMSGTTMVNLLTVSSASTLCKQSMKQFVSGTRNCGLISRWIDLNSCCELLMAAFMLSWILVCDNRTHRHYHTYYAPIW